MGNPACFYDSCFSFLPLSHPRCLTSQPCEGYKKGIKHFQCWPCAWSALALCGFLKASAMVQETAGPGHQQERGGTWRATPTALVPRERFLSLPESPSRPHGCLTFFPEGPQTTCLPSESLPEMNSQERRNGARVPCVTSTSSLPASRFPGIFHQHTAGGQ